jgi:hypothetical protein
MTTFNGESMLLSEAKRIGKKYGFEVSLNEDDKTIYLDISVDDKTPDELIDELERLQDIELDLFLEPYKQPHTKKHLKNPYPHKHRKF